MLFRSAYNNLGFFEKRNSEVTAAYNQAIASAKAINTQINSIGGAGRRKALRAKMEACPVVKEGEEKPKVDPEVEPKQDTEQQNKTYEAAGGSNDDKGPENAGANPPAVTEQTTADGVTQIVPTPATVKAIQQKRLENEPTIRTNPLNYFSSSTYQLSLYMLTPDAYNAFYLSGYTNINNLTDDPKSGAYLLLQSGGINRDTTQTAPGFELDYYIDDLRVKSIIGTNYTRTSTVVTEFNFKIIEPYGFSFLSKLKKAKDAIVGFSKLPNVDKLPNPSRYFFVIGIRFQGYDDEGKLRTGKEQVNGQVIDPTGNANGLFESFYTIVFKKLSFKIDGRTTVYNIDAVSNATDVSGTKYGSIYQNTNITAGTVYEALVGENGLIDILNNYQKSVNTELPHVYKIAFVDDIEQDFKLAQISNPKEESKYTFPMSNANTTDKVNEKTATTATPDNTKRVINLQAGINILTAVEKIVIRSDFLSKAMKGIAVSQFENDEKTDAPKIISDPTTRTVRWYNITPQVKTLGYNTTRSDWAYEITYVFSRYETPIILSPAVSKTVPYYGPVKRYEYWFTGKNTEIIHYEQTNDNSYFIQFLSTSGKDGKSQGGQAAIPGEANRPQSFDSHGELYVDKQNELSYLATDLYDPKSFSKAKITILGDPDFLIKDSFNNVSRAGVVFDQFFGPDGRTICGSNGQVFIEVNFKEAIDYDNDTGIMNINDAITFWQYPEYIKKEVNGVSFRVISATSNFRSGKFTQELDCHINTFGPDNKQWATESGTDDSQDRAEDRKSTRLNSSHVKRSRMPSSA